MRSDNGIIVIDPHPFRETNFLMLLKTFEGRSGYFARFGAVDATQIVGGARTGDEVITQLVGYVR